MVNREESLRAVTSNTTNASLQYCPLNRISGVRSYMDLPKNTVVPHHDGRRSERMGQVAPRRLSQRGFAHGTPLSPLSGWPTCIGRYVCS